MLFDQIFCVLSSVHPFCKRKPFVNQGLCVVGPQSVSVGLCNNGCVVMFAKLISSNTLSHPEIVLTRKAAVEHYMVWPKPLNVKVNIGSLQHCRHEMVILCCVFVCLHLFAFSLDTFHPSVSECKA